MEEVKYIGLGKRFVAYMIDLAIIIGFTMVMSIIITLLFLWISDSARGSMIIGLYTISYLLYFVLMDSSSHQGTLGKMMMKIKIVNKEGGRLSVLHAVGRYFGKMLTGFTLGIGFLMVLFSKDKQALHDMLAKTYVIKKDL